MSVQALEDISAHMEVERVLSSSVEQVGRLYQLWTERIKPKYQAL